MPQQPVMECMGKFLHTLLFLLRTKVTFGKTVNTTVEILAYDDETEDDIELTDVASTAIRTVEIDNTVYARDGRIYAEEGARIYSLTGLDVTRMNGNLEGIYIVKNGNKVAKVAVAK